MKYRRFGKTNWQVSEIGYGMWGMAGWTGNDEKEIEEALSLSVELGCNFFDTAWGYGEGKSERILGDLIRKFSNKKLYTASKIPPKNFKWPSKRTYTLDDCFPPEHIVNYTEKTLQNLNLERVDLMQFHVWEDSWVNDDRWKRVIENLKKEGKIGAVGISINRWEPNNSLNTIKTGLIDVVQVIYNIFDQAPEDELLPLCDIHDVAVIARVPFDEGTLTGTMTLDTKFPQDDWRSTYFVPENLKSSVEHANALKGIIPEGMTMPEMALGFILCNKHVSTTIPGMRKLNHVKGNISVSDGVQLPIDLIKKLKQHRWDREPTGWSQ